MKTLIFACVLLLGAAVAHAQGDAPPSPGAENRPTERLERLRKMRMIEMLDLKEEQSVRFYARLNEHDQTRRALRKERNDVLDRIERLVRNRADASEYEPLFRQVRDNDDKLIAEARSFMDGLKDVLTTEQRAKMFLFERRFEGELREAMREARQKHGSGQ